MKLLNKLLPIATIASAAVATVPFATSCSVSKTTSEDINVLLNQQYVRKTALKAPTTFSSIGEATKAYLEDAKNDPQIIIDDYFESFQEWYPSLLEQPDENEKYEGDFTINVKSIDPSSTKVSMELSYKLTILTFDELDASKQIDESHYDYNLVLNNFKLLTFCSEYEGYQKWSLLPGYLSITYDPGYESQFYNPLNDLDAWLLLNDKTWSVDLTIREWSDFYPESSYDNFNNTKYDYNTCKDDEKLDNLLSLVRRIHCESNYLANSFIDYNFEH